jgi:hypothetical protein
MDPDEWVAIATGAVAVATFVLALATVRLGRQAQQSTEATLGAECRPIVVPAAEQDAVSYDPGARTLTALVQNAGQTPTSSPSTPWYREVL